MKQSMLLLICFVVLCPGCSDNKPPTGMNKGTSIPTNLEGIVSDVIIGEGEKWVNKWIQVEAEVIKKTENLLTLFVPGRYTVCTIEDDPFDPQLHKYEKDQTYTFNVRVELINEYEGAIILSLVFTEVGRLTNDAENPKIITTYLETLVNEVMEGQHDKWIDKQVRFRAEVEVVLEDTISLRTARNNFTFFILGFKSKSEDFQKYQWGTFHIFTVKITDVHDNGRGGYTLTASLTGL